MLQPKLMEGGQEGLRRGLGAAPFFPGPRPLLLPFLGPHLGLQHLHQGQHFPGLPLHGFPLPPPPPSFSLSPHSSSNSSSDPSTSPPHSSKLFRPWLSDGLKAEAAEEDKAAEALKMEEGLEDSEEERGGASGAESGVASGGESAGESSGDGRARQTGSRNQRVVPVEETPALRQQSVLEGLLTNMGKSGVGHRCLYCAKVYSRKYGLKIHLRTHTGYKPLMCKICQRPFGDPSNLNKHTRLHEEERAQAFRCQLCDKLLVRRRDLHRHLLSRHGLQPPPHSPDQPHLPAFPALPFFIQPHPLS